ncbi:MAG: hypothetical protein M3R24_06225 [Chloroflexota bacterium]|nr:hypothetical protein [Chloroflexota bacterium]
MTIHANTSKPALLITSLAQADRTMFLEAAERAMTTDPVIARALTSASHNFDALMTWLQAMIADLQQGEVDAVVSQVQSMLQPIQALNDNEPILATAIAELAQSYGALQADCPNFQIPRSLMTDDESLSDLDTVLIELEDQLQEARRRIAERRQLLAGRALTAGTPRAGDDAPTRLTSRT